MRKRLIEKLPDFIINPYKSKELILQNILRHVLLILIIIGIVPTILGIVNGYRLEKYFNACAFILLYLLLIVLYVHRANIKLKSSSSLLLLFLYLFSCYNLINYSLASSSQLLLLTFVLLTDIFKGIKLGIVALILSAITFVILGCLFPMGQLGYSSSDTILRYDYFFVVIKVFVFILVSAILLFSHGYLYYNVLNIIKTVRSQKAILESNNLKLSQLLKEKILLAEELETALKKSKESEQLKTSFLACVSHEIRTPLNAIVGFSDFITEANNSPDMVEYNEVVQSQSFLLLEIVDKMVEYAKLESNSIDLSVDVHDVHVILHELYLQFIHKIPGGVCFSIWQPSERIIIKTDESRLKQVLCTLLSNAIKFTKKGNIVFGAKQDHNKIVFFVEDTGIGIASQDLETIFSRFTKVDPFSSGTGLGLTIARSIATALGGELSVESKVQCGSKFYFSLPVETTG